MREIDDGIQSVQAALGPNMMVAPFFRAPYLQITADLEQFLFKRDVMLWSIDTGGHSHLMMSSNTY